MSLHSGRCSGCPLFGDADVICRRTFCFPWVVRWVGPVPSPGVVLFSSGAALVALVCAEHAVLEGRGHKLYRPFKKRRF